MCCRSVGFDCVQCKQQFYRQERNRSRDEAGEVPRGLINNKDGAFFQSMDNDTDTDSGGRVGRLRPRFLSPSGLFSHHRTPKSSPFDDAIAPKVWLQVPGILRFPRNQRVDVCLLAGSPPTLGFRASGFRVQLQWENQC